MPEEEAAISEADAELLRDIEALLVAEEKDKIGTLYAGTFAEGHEGGPYPWQCVSGRQLVQMSDGSLKKAALVAPGDSVLSWDRINGRTTPGRVCAVARKPAARLARVFFSTGYVLEAALDHRLLTTRGWLRVSSCIQCTNDERHRPHAQIVNVLTSKKKEQGSLAGCRTYPGSGDAHFRRGQVDGRSFAPLQDDARTHTPSLTPPDDWVATRGRSPDCPIAPGSHASQSSISDLSGCRVFDTPDGRLLLNTQIGRRFGEGAAPRRGVVEVPRQEVRNDLSLPCNHPCQDVAYIIAYEILCPEPLFDFEIEEWHNYFAGGVVNHNCRFHAEGKEAHLRCIMAGNRSGKTRTGSAEVAIHLTGRYPDWWTGRRFDRPIECWVGSETNEASRDIVQKALLGPPDSPGTGMIPAEAFDPKDIQWRQAGIPDVADMVKVRHASGGISYCQFKTYEQGRKRWQGTAKDLIWLDEEPPVDIFTEAITRTLDKNGTTILTFTPLMGMGEVVLKVLSGGDGIYLVNASWDDCPHLDEQAKARLLETYPEHERATRKSGQPMLGVGAVYPVQDDEISCDPFAIPNYFRRICGIDFGINHPAAAAWIAHDADTDVIYVYDCYRKANESAPYHAAAIRRRGPWIPVAWPHDGMNRDKGSGIELAEQYRSAGVDILPFSARYDDEKGGGQPTEPVVNDILERMRTGRFKVFRSLNEWFEEKRMYHRNDRGVIVRERDDLMAATNYAVMMVRHAMSESNHLSMKRFAGQTMEPYDALGQFLRR